MKFLMLILMPNLRVEDINAESIKFPFAIVSTIDFNIALENLEFRAFHGVLPQENTVGNTFIVSVYLMAQTESESILKDDLSATISYAEVYDVISLEMNRPTKLLETLALRISLALKERFDKIKKGSISITKLSPPIRGCTGSAKVTYNF